MERINRPPLEWFTFDELGWHWNIPRSVIYRYVETGQLKRVFKKKDSRGEDVLDAEGRPVWTDKPFRDEKEGYIILAEVERWEREYRESSSGKMPFMDPEHEFYSEELALAVRAWLALYQGDGKYSPGQAHKKQIEAMLAGKGLSTAAVKRLCTVVNPQKKGGAPATGF